MKNDFQFSLYQQRLEQFLHAYLNKKKPIAPMLNSAIRYSLLGGGKRIRAILVYLTGELFQTENIVLDYAAASIEMMHAYSLIHDDLPAMDNDDLRRGKPSCHIAFGEANAILAGDALQSLAFESLASIQSSEELVSPMQLLLCFKELAKQSGMSGMVAGQVLDLESEGKSNIQLAQINKIHKYKTGALLKAAILIGFYLSPCFQNEIYLKSLTGFADALGLAFQIQDDILDITSNTESLGKNANSDIELGKATYPALIGLEKSQEKVVQLYDIAISSLNNITQDTSNLEKITNYIINRTF